MHPRTKLLHASLLAEGRQTPPGENPMAWRADWLNQAAALRLSLTRRPSPPDPVDMARAKAQNGHRNELRRAAKPWCQS